MAFLGPLILNPAAGFAPTTKLLGYGSIGLSAQRQVGDAHSMLMLETRLVAPNISQALSSSLGTMQSIEAYIPLEMSQIWRMGSHTDSRKQSSSRSRAEMLIPAFKQAIDDLEEVIASGIRAKMLIANRAWEIHREILPPERHLGMATLRAYASSIPEIRHLIETSINEIKQRRSPGTIVTATVAPQTIVLNLDRSIIDAYTAACDELRPEIAIGVAGKKKVAHRAWKIYAKDRSEVQGLAFSKFKTYVHTPEIRQVLEKAMAWMIKAGRGASRLINRLKNPKASVRFQAIMRLCDIDEPWTVEPLIYAYSRIRNYPSRLKIIEALGRRGGERAIEYLIERLDDSNKPVVCAAARALGQNGDPRGIAPLSQLLESLPTYSMVRREAIRTLASFTEPEVESILEKALGNNNAIVRMEAVRALGNRNAKQFTDQLHDLQSDPNRMVRNETARVLRNWTP